MKLLLKNISISILAIAMALATGCDPEDEPNNGGSNNSGGLETTQYTISVTASPTEGGTVSGHGSYEKGQSCTVTATPAPNHTFTCWNENDSLVSTEASYTFEVSCDRSLTAVFTSDGGGSDPLLYNIRISANPIEGGMVSGGGSYEEGQPCTVKASTNTLYTFTNWTENGHIVSDSATYTFTVTCNRNLVANFALLNAGSYVDLGLPSGTLWAACNIGATTPMDYGDFFAWGETEPSSHYGCDNYRYCNGCEYNDNLNLITLTKYCNHADFGYEGFTDHLAMLLPEDDAATIHWGAPWHMPSKEDWEELLDNTTGTMTTLDEVNGLLLTAPNGATLFFPAAGFSTEDRVWYPGYYGSYWTSVLNKEEPDGAWGFVFTSEDGLMGTSFRFCGRSIRAVR